MKECIYVVSRRLIIVETNMIGESKKDRLVHFEAIMGTLQPDSRDGKCKANLGEVYEWDFG